MTGCDRSGGPGYQTIELQVPGANCPWCFNDAMDRVRQLVGVADVRASIVGECIEVRYRDVPVSRLVDTLRTYLHGTDDSSHERQMVGVEPHVASSCGCTRSTSLAGDRPEPAGPMETLVEAMKRLRSSGYTPRLRRIGRRQPRLQRLRHQPRTRGRRDPGDSSLRGRLEPR